MKKLFAYKTRCGTFYLSQSSDGRFHPCVDDESLGSYLTIQQALEDLVGGHTFWPSSGEPSLLNIPDTLEGWQRLY